MNLNDSVLNLKGVGTSRLSMLEKLGIKTVSKLIGHFPRNYMDRSNISKIGSMEKGLLYTIKARPSRNAEVITYNSLSITRQAVSDSTGEMDIIWFNQPYMKNALLKQTIYIITGETSERNGRKCMETPLIEVFSEKEILRILPIYPLTAGITQKFLRTLIKNAIDLYAEEITEIIPPEITENYHLYPRKEAISAIHFPKSNQELELAKRTLFFTEIFSMRMMFLHMKGEIRGLEGIIFENTDIKPFISELPFKLTKAQSNAISEITTDFKSGFMMNRLIQGDVGSGKTAVAMAAIYMALKNGYQVAMMAPTETLARQHYAAFSEIFTTFGFKTVLLTGSLKVSEKRQIKSLISSGEANIIIGTHALITESTEFNNLALVICDEQHRFGVRQRGALTDKGVYPHTLVMSATPIPRTLAIILYGDLDMTIIDELPPGRIPIETITVDSRYRQRIFNFIKKQSNEGRQAYIVCPVIEDSGSELKSVKSYSVEVEKATGLKTAIIHGKMKQEEKSRIMDGYSKGDIKILVSTTVIEVGINVPNASVMLVENAERFGLAQLHQLRGRVGRDKHKSYCILISDSQSETAKERLEAMVKSNDGFNLAELDLKSRGPGDFFGVRQHGLSELLTSSLYSDSKSVKEAHQAAEEFFMSGGVLDVNKTKYII